MQKKIRAGEMPGGFVPKPDMMASVWSTGPTWKESGLHKLSSDFHRYAPPNIHTYANTKSV